MRRLRLARRALAAVISLSASLALAGATGATTGSLPGGTSIGVSIATPANGSTLPPGPVSLTGTAEVGTAVAVPSALLFYVLDLSGSTSSIVFGSACGQQNTPMDLVANTILDCEI